MMDKITELTPEQIAAMPEFRDKWLAAGLSTEPANRNAAEAGMAKAYKAAGLEPPKLFIWLGSPMAGAVCSGMLNNQGMAQVWGQVVDQIRGQVRDQVGGQVRYQVWDQVWDQVADQIRDQVYNAIYGQHDSPWLAFYNFFRVICGITSCNPLIGLEEVAINAGWCWAFKNIAVMTERPEFIRRDNDNRLHSEIGPAIQYPDGWGFHAWHGTRIPGEWIEKKDALIPEIALTWENAEQRRAACEIIGWNALLEKMGAKLIDSDEDDTIGHLYEVNHDALGGRCRFLRMYCPTGRWFAEPVPPDMNTALEANAWGWGLAPGEYKPTFQS